VVLIFDGGIKSVAEEINGATLLKLQLSFEGFALPTSYQTPGTSSNYTHPHPASSEKSENCDSSVTV
jgi:hypothetical protein